MQMVGGARRDLHRRQGREGGERVAGALIVAVEIEQARAADGDLAAAPAVAQRNADEDISRLGERLNPLGGSPDLPSGAELLAHSTGGSEPAQVEELAGSGAAGQHFEIGAQLVRWPRGTGP